MPDQSTLAKARALAVTPAMVKAAWCEARRWWPRKIVQDGKRFVVVETCIAVDEPQPGFREAIEAALAAALPSREHATALIEARAIIRELTACEALAAGTSSSMGIGMPLEDRTVAAYRRARDWLARNAAAPAEPEV